MTDKKDKHDHDKPKPRLRIRFPWRQPSRWSAPRSHLQVVRQANRVGHQSQVW